MPFTCAICTLPIEVGQPMLSDEKMNLAHESCVTKVNKADPPPPSLSVNRLIATGLPIPKSTVKLYEGSCVPSSGPRFCGECGKPSISMCPSCLQYVHQDYGYNGSNCSGRHEAKCDGARKSRVPPAPDNTEKAICKVMRKRAKKSRKNGRHR